MKINFQRGFAPLLLIAIVAILAVGGGVYVSKKNKENKAPVVLEDNVDTQANAKADAKANANANLGINANGKAKGSLRLLLAVGEDTQCTFTGVNNGVTSSGTVYISPPGNMRGEFKSVTSTGTVNSSMVMKEGFAYVWSGTQGAKMSTTYMASAEAKAQAKQSVDLDSTVDYDCRDWTVDQSKFVLPSSVTFVDIEALMKIKVQ